MTNEKTLTNDLCESDYLYTEFIEFTGDNNYCLINSIEHAHRKAFYYCQHYWQVIKKIMGRDYRNEIKSISFIAFSESRISNESNLVNKARFYKSLRSQFYHYFREARNVKTNDFTALKYTEKFDLIESYTDEISFIEKHSKPLQEIVNIIESNNGKEFIWIKGKSYRCESILQELAQADTVIRNIDRLLNR